MPDKSEEDIFNILKRFEIKETNDKLDALFKRLGDIATEVALLSKASEKQEKDIDDMKTDLHEIKSMADKWRGAFVLLLGIGGASGVALAYWDRFSKWVHP